MKRMKIYFDKSGFKNYIRYWGFKSLKEMFDDCISAHCLGGYLMIPIVIIGFGLAVSLLLPFAVLVLIKFGDRKVKKVEEEKKND